MKLIQQNKANKTINTITQTIHITHKRNKTIAMQTAKQLKPNII